MVRFLRYNTLIYFLAGAYIYGLIEVLFRGYTHPSMMIAGGICFVLISAVSTLKINLVFKSIICGIFITIIEFIFGCIFNIFLNMQVWDYSDQPFNILGQVCPLFIFLWCGLSVFAIFIAIYMEKELSKSIKKSFILPKF